MSKILEELKETKSIVERLASLLTDLRSTMQNIASEFIYAAPHCNRCTRIHKHLEKHALIILKESGEVVPAKGLTEAEQILAKKVLTARPTTVRGTVRPKDGDMENCSPRNLEIADGKGNWIDGTTAEGIEIFKEVGK